MTFRLIVATTIAVSIATVVVVRLAKSQHTANGPKTPFTVVLVEKFFAYPSGVFAQQEESTYAVKSDGSEVRLQTRVAPDGRKTQQRTIFDTKERVRIGVDGLTKSTTTTKATEQYAASFASRPAGCGEQPGAQRSNFLGYEVVRIDSEQGGPTGDHHFSELWVAPALDCYPLKRTHGIVSDRARVITNVSEAMSISLGEPSPELFLVPAGYTERKPSEVFAEYGRRYSGPPVLGNPGMAQQLDQIYSSGRPLGSPPPPAGAP